MRGALENQEALDGLLLAAGSVLTAFSGGVDSAYLAVRAHRVLGSRALAVTADSESLPRKQRETAALLARRFGFAHEWVRTRELQNPLYVRNDRDRCYHCKVELFQTLIPLARSRGFSRVAYGFLADDLSDFRPGHRAAVEAGVMSPLAEVGLVKAEVRELSRELDLPTWDEPASPCLSSRIPYETRVTEEALQQVDEAEARVRALGFREFRVRHYGRVARVEIARAEIERLQGPGVKERLESSLREAGYSEVVLDPEGYRRGRLNEVAPPR
jgi:uncharacterized protein